ncbi:MAG: glutamate-5-semialdehyde dehydrogenase [Acidimicrobiales bacterium]
MTTLNELGQRAKSASLAVALASSQVKNEALLKAAELLMENSDEVLGANAADVAQAKAAGTSSTVIDRLRLTGARVSAMADGLRQVASLPDPVGEVVDGWVRPNGLRVERVRVPLGVVGIIYENRPNVTSDAAGLCLKSGNVAFLRGSSAALTSNKAIARLLREGFARAGLPSDALVLVEDTSYSSAREFMRLRGVIDCLIPRGGPSLVNAIIENATVPYVIDGDGNCHLYVDASADLDMAVSLIVNGKMQRPSVCNATESLVVHRDVAKAFLPAMAEALKGVRLLGDEAAREIVPSMEPATEQDWGKEYLDLVLSVRVVDDLSSAIAHVQRYSSGHTEAIVTRDLLAAQRFTREVDAAVVMVNASTRFTDGGEFGFGAEIGISTQKLHARGPMGLRELTTTKYIVTGNGQVRT